MPSLRLSSAAETDLAAIDAYSAEEFGDDVADAYMRGFGQAFDLLRQHPKVGAVWPELGEDIRCLMHRRHRIFYQDQGDRVLIVRVVHHAMDVRRALKGGAG